MSDGRDLDWSNRAPYDEKCMVKRRGKCVGQCLIIKLVYEKNLQIDRWIIIDCQVTGQVICQEK